MESKEFTGVASDRDLSFYTLVNTGIITENGMLQPYLSTYPLPEFDTNSKLPEIDTKLTEFAIQQIQKQVSEHQHLPEINVEGGVIAQPFRIPPDAILRIQVEARKLMEKLEFEQSMIKRNQLT